MILFIVLTTILFIWLTKKLVTNDLLSPFYMSSVFLFSSLYFLTDRTTVQIEIFSLYIYIFCMIFLFLPSIVLSKTLGTSTRALFAQKVSMTVFSNRHLYFVVGAWLVCFTLYIYVEFLPLNTYCPVCSMIAGDASSLPEKVHRVGKDSPLQIITSQLPILSCLILSILYTKTDTKRYRLLYLLMVLLPPILGVIKTSKSDVLFPLVGYGIIFYYISGVKIKSKYVVFSGFILAFMLYMTSLRVESLGGVYTDLIDYDNSYDVFAFEPIFFGYTAGSVANLFYYMGYYDLSGNSNYIGFSFFRPIFTLALATGDIDYLYSQHYVPNLGPGATVGTFLRPLIAEGGIFLALLGSLTYGVFIALVYHRFMSKSSLRYMLYYSVLYIPWFMMIFQNLFANLNIYFSLIVISLFFMIGKINYER